MNEEKVYLERSIDPDSAVAFEVLAAAKIPGVPEIKNVDAAGAKITEEKVSGTPLSEYMEQDLDLSQVTEIICGICDVLSKLHGLSPAVLHGHLSADNVIIAGDGAVYLTGICAPQPSGGMPADPFTDIKPLGHILEDMLKGAALEEVRGDDKMSAGIDDIIYRAAADDPEERFTTVMDVKSALLRIEPMTTADQIAAGAARAAEGYALPGFRTKKPLKMIIAVIGYFLMFVTAVNVDFGTKGAQLACERAFCFFGFFAAALVLFNYRGVLNDLPLSKSESPGAHRAGAVIYALLSYIVIMTIGGFFSILFA
ncbi:MAG: hypothetical protein VZQ84_04525 [Anaerovoracaceae bacterium]|nr:hypothetical protein [Anaerovoracaceae bacterium]